MCSCYCMQPLLASEHSIVVHFVFLLIGLIGEKKWEHLDPHNAAGHTWHKYSPSLSLPTLVCPNFMCDF